MPIVAEPISRISLSELARGTRWRSEVESRGIAEVVRYGEPLAYVLSPQEYERYERLLGEDELRREEAEVREIFEARAEDLDRPAVSGLEHLDEALTLVNARLATLERP